MEPTQQQPLAPNLQWSDAWAFDRRRSNRRPAFLMQQTLQHRSDGTWLSRRDWRAVGPEPIASETIIWRDRLQESACEQYSIEEVTRATPLPDGCRCTLRSTRTAGKDRERRLVLPHPAVTLASLPLFIAQHWFTLAQGASMRASYLVLKVQRAATVHLQRVASGTSRELVVAATPANPLLRWIFGSTQCVFEADAPRLRRIEGLLDPRDLKHNGRWQEYLGTIEFSRALDLGALAQQPVLR